MLGTKKDVAIMTFVLGYAFVSKSKGEREWKRLSERVHMYIFGHPSKFYDTFCIDLYNKYFFIQLDSTKVRPLQ